MTTPLLELLYLASTTTPYLHHTPTTALNPNPNPKRKPSPKPKAELEGGHRLLTTPFLELLYLVSTTTSYPNPSP